MHQFLNKCEYCTTKQFIKCFPPFEDTKVLALVPSVLEEVHFFLSVAYTTFIVLLLDKHRQLKSFSIKYQNSRISLSVLPASPDNAVSQIRNRLCDDRLLCVDKE